MAFEFFKTRNPAAATFWEKITMGEYYALLPWTEFQLDILNELSNSSTHTIQLDPIKHKLDPEDAGVSMKRFYGTVIEATLEETFARYITPKLSHDLLGLTSTLPHKESFEKNSGSSLGNLSHLPSDSMGAKTIDTMTQEPALSNNNIPGNADIQVQKPISSGTAMKEASRHVSVLETEILEPGVLQSDSFQVTASTPSDPFDAFLNTEAIREGPCENNQSQTDCNPGLEFNDDASDPNIAMAEIKNGPSARSVTCNSGADDSLEVVDNSGKNSQEYHSGEEDYQSDPSQLMTDHILPLKHASPVKSSSPIKSKPNAAGKRALDAFAEARKFHTGDGVQKDSTKAVKFYRIAAKSGHMESQRRLGECYLNEDGVRLNLKQSKYWFEKAAEQGCPIAQTELASFYSLGLLEERNMNIAMSWLSRAAEQRYPKAYFELAHCLRKVDPQRYSTEIKRLFKLAFEGFKKEAPTSREAQHDLAECYHTGLGVTEDHKLAYEWYKKSADLGEPEAQCSVGVFHSLGLGGVEVNRDIALKWFQKSADNGSALGLLQLGDCYRVGTGVESDINRAWKCYKASARRGCIQAITTMGEIHWLGEMGTSNLKAAFKEFSKAAERGDARSEFNLGECYYHGHGVAQSKANAHVCYVKALRNMLQEAEIYAVTFLEDRIGDCYFYGKGTERDTKEAEKWYLKAIERDDVDALVALGDLKMEAGVFNEAAIWYGKAKELGYDDIEGKFAVLNDAIAESQEQHTGVSDNSFLAQTPRATVTDRLIDCMCRYEGASSEGEEASLSDGFVGSESGESGPVRKRVRVTQR